MLHYDESFPSAIKCPSVIQHTYSSTKNQLTGIERNGTSVRTFSHDNSGNLLTDVQGGVTTTYAYNNANRMASFTKGSVTTGTYTYNARGQLVIRNVTNSSNNGITVYFYDQQGHVIAEYDGTNGNLIREYVWLGDMPLAVIDPGSTTYYVHADHLNRPVAMTNAAKAFVANYVWLPYGGLHSYTGTTEVDLRFPGQLMQAESGLYYNWHRQYDPTTGRYTQADPLGLVDGSSRYAYVGNDPLQQVDPTGRLAIFAAAPAIGGWVSGLLGTATGAIIGHEVWPHVFPAVNNEVQDPDSCPVPIPEDPTQPPGPEWEWHGDPDFPVGSDKGAWYNPGTGESLHPDLDHADPIGPHWDYIDPSKNRTRYGPR